MDLCELKAELKFRGLAVGGKLEELRERLVQNDIDNKECGVKEKSMESVHKESVEKDKSKGEKSKKSVSNENAKKSVENEK